MYVDYISIKLAKTIRHTEKIEKLRMMKFYKGETLLLQ